MGFGDDQKDKPKADFSNVQSGSSSTAPPPAAAPTPAFKTYVVQKGDSLSKIAKAEYGNANDWRRIFEANKDTIKNPDLIHPGQSLKIPPA
jgi:nucleoid-associated protein YgaU